MAHIRWLSVSLNLTTSQPHNLTTSQPHSLTQPRPDPQPQSQTQLSPSSLLGPRLPWRSVWPVLQGWCHTQLARRSEPTQQTPLSAAPAVPRRSSTSSSNTTTEEPRIQPLIRQQCSIPKHKTPPLIGSADDPDPPHTHLHHQLHHHLVRLHASRFHQQIPCPRHRALTASTTHRHRRSFRSRHRLVR